MANGLMRPASWMVLAAVLIGGCATGAPPRNPSPPQGQALIEVDRRAEAAYEAGRHAEAAELYESLVTAMPTDAGYWYRLGNAYVRAGRSSEAVLAYEQSLAIEPANARAWHNLGITLMRQAEQAFARGASSAQGGERVRSENQRLADALRAVAGASPADAAAARTDGGDAAAFGQQGGQ